MDITCQDLLSIISLVVTIILGVGAIIQSKHYNKVSDKINADMQYINTQQVELLDEIEKTLMHYTRDTSKLRLTKDEIHLHKLSTFRKNDVDEIMKKIDHLSIKGRFKNKIEEFLKSNHTDYECNFWGEAKSDGEINIKEFYSILLEYGIHMHISYK